MRGGCQTHKDPLTGLRRQRQDLPPVRWGSRGREGSFSTCGRGMERSWVKCLCNIQEALAPGGTMLRPTSAHGTVPQTTVGKVLF